MKAMAANEADTREVARKDGVGRRRDYFGTPGTVGMAPQGFLVERPYAGEATPVLCAGDAGADVLALQFCRPSERPGADPRTLASRDPGGYVLKHEK